MPDIKSQKVARVTALMVVSLLIAVSIAVVAQESIDSSFDRTASGQSIVASGLGDREATYTIDHMFELYEKSHYPADRGRWNQSLGLNEWWPLRAMIYWQYVARPAFPFVMVSNPYSAVFSPDISQGGEITTWYRLTIDAKNLTDSALGPGKDPIFAPVLGSTAAGDGAWMNITWYGTYLETWELVALRAGTHYGNTYYGVPAVRATPSPASDDGYYHELQGEIQFNRAAAAKVLGLTTTDDLRDQFSANDSSITADWLNDWVTEGGNSGAYDIHCAYDYPLQIQWLELSLDPESTADDLTIRFWCCSWGNEILLARYMEAANVTRYWQGWPDDWYLNISIGPESADVCSRAVISYGMFATKDSKNDINGWALEATHLDRAWYDPSPWYYSRFNEYSDATRVSWAPLTVNFGKPVNYAHPPLHWNLSAGEKLVVRLPPPSTLVPGYWPKPSSNDILGPPKISEMAGNCTWGQLVAGNGYPSSGPCNLKSFYNRAARTYTLQGPIDFPVDWNPAYPSLLGTGAPMFLMNVVRSQSLDLQQGWNLVSALYTGYGYTASTLGLSHGDVIARYEPPGYHILVVDGPGEDFPILPSTGYWIYVSVSKTLTLYGDLNHSPPVTRTITVGAGGGWTIVALNSEKSTWKASDLDAMYSGRVSTVVRWDAAAGCYVSFITGLPMNDFPLVPGDAYWMFCEESGVLSYVP